MKQTIFVTMLATLLMVTGCSNQNVNAEKHQEISTWMVGEKINYGVFSFDAIIDIICEDGRYYIKYDDPDGWDYSTLAYEIGLDEWPLDYYMLIEIPDDLIQDFLDDYAKWSKSNWEIQWAIEDSWSIREELITFDDGTKTIKFEVINQSWESTLDM